MYFEKYDASEIEGTPQQYIEKLKQNKLKLEKELSEALNEQSSFVKSILKNA